MDRIGKETIKYFITLTIGILIGMVIGAVSLNTLISYRIDEYFKEITYLNSVIEDKDVRLKKLEESVNKRKFILGSIEIILICEEGDEIDKITLNKHIKEKFNNLLGKEVRNIDIEMVAEVIDKRIMKVDENEYKLNVKKILLAEELKIWVEVK